MRYARVSKMATALIVALVAIVFLLAPPARAADNTGSGDIAGVDADLSDSNTFSLSTTTLGLIKRAFLASSGAALASGASLPRGTQVKFMIYINNTTAVPVSDVSVQDVLDAAFLYDLGTIKVDNSVANCAAAACTGIEEAAIFAAVDATAALNDAVGVGDVASYVGTTIDVGDAAQANAQLDILGSRVWAVSFTVTMQ